MATQDQYDFRKVMDTVWEDLLDYMKPDLVLTKLRKEHSTFRRRKLRDLEEKYSTTTEKSSAILQLVKDTGLDAYSVLKKCLHASGQNALLDFIEAAEKNEDLAVLKERLETELEEVSEEEKMFMALKEGLIIYYREHESTMPVAPLVEQHETELTNFYVRSPMMACDKPNAFGQGEQTCSKAQSQQDGNSQKIPIKKYRHLLFNTSERYKKIYVTADAGMGKTSFSKMLAVTWCQAHQPDPHIAEKFDQDDLETMKSFDFLFLIHLRDLSDKGVCSLDDMILCMLTSNLPKASSYSKEFVEQTLCSKICLVIADGLDEWKHPENCQSLRQEVIPHNKDWKGCSVLTTTRPWKLSSARLPPRCIDKQIEITELDENTSKKLISYAIEFLNENQKQNNATPQHKPKRQNDFKLTETERQLCVIRYIPYILLQMICLWYEGKRIGNSLCEVYSNIIELTLTCWLVKTDAIHRSDSCDCKREETVLNCMKSNTHCQREMALILKIAKLAFFSLFNKEKERTLLFDSDFVLQHLDKSEIERCLAIGLLSQNKDSCALSSVRFIYFFPHKSIQEFFAGVHIALNWDENARHTIFRACNSVSALLEMSGVFVFVCGMNPEVYSAMSRAISGVVDNDPAVMAWRSSVLINIWATEYKTIKLYQDMQVKCLTEGLRNGHLNCKIVIKDISVDDFSFWDAEAFNSLKKLILNNASNMISLAVFGLSGEDMVQTEFPCLMKLHMSPSSSRLASVLASASALEYLRIDTGFKLECIHLTDHIVQAITSLSHLRGLYLEHTRMSCDNLDNSLTYIRTNKSLSQLCLDDVVCFKEKQHKTGKRPYHHLNEQKQW